MSSNGPAYLDYTNDEDFSALYLDYQRRYAEQPRESDRALVDVVRREVEGTPSPAILDVGCSTGNLVRHLRRELPEARLTGGDLMEEHLVEARQAADLVGVDFVRMDMLDIDRALDEAFDVVIANAVLTLFDAVDLRAALCSTRRVLRPGGAFVAFDLMHPYAQELEIHEVSATHPLGIVQRYRPYATVERALRDAGLAPARFAPFEIPIDLPRPESDDDIRSFTVTREEGPRLLFRGALAQPWCHLLARRDA